HTPYIKPLSLHDALPILYYSYRPYDAPFNRVGGQCTDLTNCPNNSVTVTAAIPDQSTMSAAPYGLSGGYKSSFGLTFGTCGWRIDRKSTRLNSSHDQISY